MRAIVPEFRAGRTERTAVPYVIGDSGLPAAALSVRGVSKRLGGLPVLRGIDLDVQPGTVAVVAGPSGSGKSTLLRCICHLETVDAGEIRLGGQLVGYDLGGPPGFHCHALPSVSLRRLSALLPLRCP